MTDCIAKKVLSHQQLDSQIMITFWNTNTFYIVEDPKFNSILDSYK